jgi:acid stress-induced BolA-like protein IbaG/YrbA
MDQAQLVDAIQRAFSTFVLLDVKPISGEVDRSRPPSFSGVLVDASFDGKSELERSRLFRKNLLAQMDGKRILEVRLRLLSKSEYGRLTQQRI